MINNCTLMGRICNDIELLQTSNGTALTKFSIAVERNYTNSNGERPTDFIRCCAWAGTAEFIAKYFRKGSMIAITGEIQTSTYDEDNGNDCIVTRYVTEINVNNVSFTGEKPNDTQTKPKYNKTTKNNKYTKR